MGFGIRRRRERLEDDLELSQYGSNTSPKGGPAFRALPRERDKGEVSMTRGRLTAAQAHSVVGLQAPREGDGVRWTTVGRLRGSGFVVIPRPTQGNPNHVVVSAGKGSTWTPDDAERFNQCFTEAPEWLESASIHSREEGNG
jgi:hypothetical protein